MPKTKSAPYLRLCSLFTDLISICTKTYSKLHLQRQRFVQDCVRRKETTNRIVLVVHFTNCIKDNKSFSDNDTL